MKKRLLLLILLAEIPACSPCPAGVVADALWFEARGEDRAGLEAVASVIVNRSQKTGHSLKATVLARKQFSCFDNGWVKPNPRNEREREILAFCEGLERQMQSGTFKPKGNWTGYHTTAVCPYWSKSMTEKKVIGNHLFGIQH